MPYRQCCERDGEGELRFLEMAGERGEGAHGKVDGFSQCCLLGLCCRIRAGCTRDGEPAAPIRIGRQEQRGDRIGKTAAITSRIARNDVGEPRISRDARFSACSRDSARGKPHPNR